MKILAPLPFEPRHLQTTQKTVGMRTVSVNKQIHVHVRAGNKKYFKSFDIGDLAPSKSLN